MKNLTATICLTLAVLLGSAGVSASAEFHKGVAAYKSGDYAAALREWEPLAEQGNTGAQSNLGYMHSKGHGVPQDYKLAVKWYTLAAEQGDASAQFNLGWMYDKGHGVIRDDIYAHMWGSIAASNGNESGGKLRDTVEQVLTPPQLETAQRFARECVRKKYKEC